jgi:hypothetical protein
MNGGSSIPWFAGWFSPNTIEQLTLGSPPTLGCFTKLPSVATKSWPLCHLSELWFWLTSLAIFSLSLFSSVQLSLTLNDAIRCARLSDEDAQAV